MIIAYFVSGKISSNEQEANDLFANQRFGEKKEEKVFYTLSESLFLVEEKKMKILDNKDNEISKKELLKKFEKLDSKFKTKYFVFKDLRKKGYIVKTGLKFGAEFRVYDKGKSVGKHHAKWIVFPVDEHDKMTWHDFSAKNRVAHSTKKKLLIAIVDEENDVSYYEVDWKRV